MVRSNLHIICGNCGSNEELTHTIELEGNDLNGTLIPAAYIKCGNCSTFHDLSDTVDNGECYGCDDDLNDKQGYCDRCNAPICDSCGLTDNENHTGDFCNKCVEQSNRVNCVYCNCEETKDSCIMVSSNNKYACSDSCATDYFDETFNGTQQQNKSEKKWI